MITKLIIYFVIFRFVTTQLNGEFWWLNSKIAELKLVEPPRPKFEDISEFDTDDTAKVVFKDTDLSDTENTEKYPDTITQENKPSDAIIYFRDDSKLTNQFNAKEPEKTELQNNVIKTFDAYENDIKKHDDDLFSFIFPDNADVIKNKAKIDAVNSLNSTKQTNTKNIIFNEKKIFDTEIHKFLSENICTYMKAMECDRCQGVPYNFKNTPKSTLNSINDENICCILPLHKQKSSKISFLESYDRLKRSVIEQDISLALKQRNALMRRKYGTQTSNTQAPTTSTISQKIVIPETEYIDPYWNIKGSNFKRPDKQEAYLTGISHQEYDDDYTEELPKPGLVGLYSDHRPFSWSFINAHRGFSYYNEDNSEEEGIVGYSTIDPRRGHSPTSNIKRRYLKLPKSSEDLAYPETQTLSYLSNPDFQVLQGFKLPNLKPKTDTPHMRNLRRPTTTERNPNRSAEKSQYESYIDRDYDDYIDQQIYKECGRTKNEYVSNHNCDRDVGESPRGAHPWLLLAVLTKSRQSILCYATLIHPLAAITAADCTYGISPGEITIIAGMWDLEGDNRTQLQHRLASVYVHQQYSPGKLAYNNALLYWRRPLKLDATVKPACISDSSTGDACIFVGWGGYDQAIQPRPKWQRASILPPRSCEEKISANQAFDLPFDAFCATVNSKTSFTGLGGPLICKSENSFSVTGFAIWRDDVIVLMRIQEWAIRAMSTLGIN